MVEYSAYKSFALDLADAARAIVKERLALPMTFITKDDQSPVTEVDRNVEAALRRMIKDRYPEHGVLGEEYASENLDSEYVWVIDPIDGTKAFITGIPVFGTLIALTRNGVPMAGVIDHPVTDERWVGVEGEPSTYNGMPIRTRPCPALGDAIVSLGNQEALTEAELIAFSDLKAETKWRVYGGSCYVYGRLAMGRIDISLDGGLDPFDFCALDVVVRGAGGMMTDWQGERLTIHSGSNVVACGDPALHAKAVGILKAAGMSRSC